MVHIGTAAAPQRTPQRPELVPDVVSYTTAHAIYDLLSLSSSTHDATL
jgi:hypothetical protein